MITPHAERVAKLRAATGLDHPSLLSVDEARLLSWIAKHDEWTVDTLASLLERVRRAAIAEGEAR